MQQQRHIGVFRHVGKRRAHIHVFPLDVRVHQLMDHTVHLGPVRHVRVLVPLGLRDEPQAILSGEVEFRHDVAGIPYDVCVRIRHLG